MVLLDPNDPVKKGLEQLDTAITDIAKNCIYTIFNKQCIIADDWYIVDRLNGDFPHNICLGCGNDAYQALAVLGTGNKVIEEFIGDMNSDAILDAFGEMLNTYFGMLMDNPIFVENFGILNQALAHYSADINFYSKAWGLNGTLITPQKGSVYFGFAIKGNQQMQP